MRSALTGSIHLFPETQEEQRWVGRICQRLTFSNPDFYRAQQVGRSTRGVDPSILFWDQNPEGWYTVPRATLTVDEYRQAHLPDPPKPRLRPEPLRETWTPREGQREAVEAVVRAVQQYPFGGILEARGGRGKTVMGLQIHRMLRSAATLVIVPTEVLAQQWETRIREHVPGARVGRIQGERFDTGYGCDFVVAMVQSLTQRLYPQEVYRSFDLLLGDECFPAGTKIRMADGGERDITTIQVGDGVCSFDEATGAVVVRRVSETFSRFAQTLVRVAAGGASVVCTPNHPFWTRRGWVRAEDLQPDDDALVFSDDVRRVPPGDGKTTAVVGPDAALRSVHRGSAGGAAQEVRGPVREVRRYDRSEGQAGPQHVCPQREGVLLGDVSGRLDVGDVLRDDGGHEQEVRFRAHEGAESHAGPRGSRAGAGDSAEDRPSALGSGGERENDPGSPGDARQGARVGGGVPHPYRDEAGVGVSDLLQGGHRESPDPGGDRSRWGLPHGLRSPGAGSEEGGVPRWARVDRVEVLESRGLGGPGGGGGEGTRVYNFAVDGTRTYVASGFVVHNCHHLGAVQWSKAASSFLARWRVGLTATARRKDGLEPVFVATIGPIVHRMPEPREGVVPGRVLVVKVPYLIMAGTYMKWGRPNMPKLVTALSRHARRNETIVDLIGQLRHGGRKVLVLTGRVDHVRDLAVGLHERHAITSSAIIGGQDQAEREAAKDSRVIIGTYPAAQEGLDIPDLDALVLATPQKDVEQAAYRPVRQYPGKRDAIIVDVVDDQIPMCDGLYRARCRTYRHLGYRIEPQ